MAHLVIRAARATHKPMVVGVLVLSLLATLVAPLAAFTALAAPANPETECSSLETDHPNDLTWNDEYWKIQIEEDDDEGLELGDWDEDEDGSENVTETDIDPSLTFDDEEDAWVFSWTNEHDGFVVMGWLEKSGRVDNDLHQGLWENGEGDSDDVDGSLSHVTICFADAPEEEEGDPIFTLTLHKTVVGGDAIEDDFTPSIDGYDGDDVAWEVAVPLDPGDYTVDEDWDVENYVPGAWDGDCDANGDITIPDADEDADFSCSITNTYEAPEDDSDPATLTIVKDVTGDTVESWSFDFSGDLGDFNLADDDTQHESGELDAGSYTVTEDELPDDWALTGISCDGTDEENITVDLGNQSVTADLQEGDNVTCTFTNTYEEPEEEEEPTYTISGVVFNDEDNDGEDWNCAFSSEEEEGEPDCEELLSGWTVQIWQGEELIHETTSASDGSYSFSVPAGTYTVCEVVQSGWNQTYPAGGDCYDDITVPDDGGQTQIDPPSHSLGSILLSLFTVPTAHAQTTTFNFGNFNVPTTTTTTTTGGGGGSPNLVIEKTVSDEFTTGGATLTYTITVTNTGNATAINVVLEDVMDPFLDGTPGSTRTWALGNMAQGESKTVTYLIDVPAGIDPGVYQNVATVSAANYPARSSDVDVEIREPEVLGEEDIPEPEPEPEVKGVETLPETGGVSDAMATFGLVTMTLLMLYGAAIAGLNRRRKMQN